MKLIAGFTTFPFTRQKKDLYIILTDGITKYYKKTQTTEVKVYTSSVLYEADG